MSINAVILTRWSGINGNMLLHGSKSEGKDSPSNRQAKDLQDSSAAVSLQNEILHFVQDDNDRIEHTRFWMNINVVILSRQAKDLQDSNATVSLQNEILHFVQDDNDRIGRACLRIKFD